MGARVLINGNWYKPPLCPPANTSAVRAYAAMILEMREDEAGELVANRAILSIIAGGLDVPIVEAGTIATALDERQVLYLRHLAVAYAGENGCKDPII